MTIRQAMIRWIETLGANYTAPSTLRKYRHEIGGLAVWAERQQLELGTISALDLQQFRASRPISRNTASKTTQIIKAFFRFSEEQQWIPISPAAQLKIPRFRVPDNVPYTEDQIIRILAACEKVGQDNYERRRARAAIWWMRRRALRMADVVLLRRDAVCEFDGPMRLRLRTKKNGQELDHRLSKTIWLALASLPSPEHLPARGQRPVAVESPYWFWNGVSEGSTALTDMHRLLHQVYRLSGVPKAHNHRWRHTLASEILLAGGSMADVAQYFGITSKIAEKHYAKFMPERQSRMDQIVERAVNRQWHDAQPLAGSGSDRGRRNAAPPSGGCERPRCILTVFPTE